VIVRAAGSGDAEAIAAIYNHFVAETVVTFEEDPVAVAEMARRIEATRSSGFPWLVTELDQQVVGYAYAAPWKSRSAYRFACEVTVYLAPDRGGRGLGSALYAALFPLLDAKGLHVAIGGISLPNEASVALHERFGMHKVAHFEQVGFKLGRWVDVGYWQRTLGAG
jgi:L-amino acid N-acyltransferase YncA